MWPLRGAVFLVAIACLVPATSFAQAYPDKPVRVLVGFSPGGFTDVLARLIAQKLQERLGQPFVVENKPGAAGTIAADAVAKAKPDGYTLLMGHSNSNSIAPALYPKLPYDVIKDFTPDRDGRIDAVHADGASVGAGDRRQDASSRTRRRRRFATRPPGQGSGQHLAAEQFILQTGIKMTHIPYKGSGQAITDLLSGQVELNFESPPNTLQHIKAGKLKTLGITSAKRSALLPDVPTIAEQGLPGYEIIQWFGDIRSAGHAEADRRQAQHRDQRDHEDARCRREDRVAGRHRHGRERPRSFAAYIRSDVPKWDKLVKAANIKLD